MLMRSAGLTFACVLVAACGSGAGPRLGTAGGSSVSSSSDVGSSSGGAGGAGGASASSGGGGSGGGVGGAGGAAPAEPALVARTFTESAGELLNPERGFYGTIDLLGSSTFSSIRGEGMTLALAGVKLDAFRDKAIDEATLTKIGAGLARARAASIKVILRFQYNDGPVGADDASLARIQGHLTQLEPILAEYADVIALMQAGFIGAWGEWHSSTHGLDTDDSRKAVLESILAALPASRMVQVRTPHFVDAIFPGGALTAEQAFSDTNAARTAHHNDCFLASDDDEGTYEQPVETWKDYVAQGSRFTPSGGETCADNPPRSECASAKAELERLHYRFLNSEYHPGVLDSWTSGGCMAEITQRLGYRFVLEQLEHSGEVRPGGALHLTWTLQNKGYGAIFNARPLQVVLESGATKLTATLGSVDVRRWEPGAVSGDVRLRLPASIPPGDYKVSLALPDADAALGAKPLYAIQLANAGVWDAASGVNVVIPALSVSDSAPGEVDPSAAAFVELP